MDKPQSDQKNIENKYLMKVVSLKTGLTDHAIRAWERRHNAVTPSRDSNNRRFYTLEDIEKLTLLKKATDAGFGISQVASKSIDELKEMIESIGAKDIPVKRVSETPGPKFVKQQTSYENYIEYFMSALEQMDSSALENLLIQAQTDYGINAMVEHVVIPLMEQIGEGWRTGKLRVAHEHLASHVIRTFLGGVLSGQKSITGAPNVLVTTPSDQWHDIGALIFAVTAASEGWNVIYLGANLPSEEIAGTVRQNNCKAVILSIIYPEDDPVLVREITKLRKALGDNVYIIAGGRASTSYKGVLEEVGAFNVGSLYEMRTTLESLRSEI